MEPNLCERCILVVKLELTVEKSLLNLIIGWSHYIFEALSIRSDWRFWLSIHSDRDFKLKKQHFSLEALPSWLLKAKSCFYKDFCHALALQSGLSGPRQHIRARKVLLTEVHVFQIRKLRFPRYREYLWILPSAPENFWGGESRVCQPFLCFLAFSRAEWERHSPFFSFWNDLVLFSLTLLTF